MPSDNAITIVPESLPIAGPGQKVRYTADAPVPATLAAAARTLANFILPKNTVNDRNMKINATLSNSAVAAADKFHMMHTGFLCVLEKVRLSQISKNVEMYNCQSVSYMTKLRNMIYYSREEVERFSPTLPICASVANSVQANIDSLAVAGSLFNLAAGNGAAGLAVALQSTPAYSISSAGLAGMIEVGGRLDPVQRVATAWNANTAQLALSVKLSIDCHLLGGHFSTDKYIPYPLDRKLELTFNPTDYFAWRTDAYALLDANVATSMSSTFLLTDLYVEVDQASAPLSAQLDAMLLSSGFMFPESHLIEQNVVIAANQATSNIPWALNNGYGSRLRSVFSGVFTNSTTTTQLANNSNLTDTVDGSADTSHQKVLSFRSQFNKIDLQPNDIDVNDCYNYLKEDLQAGCYSGYREYLANTVFVDNFCKPYKLSDKSITNMDIGEPLNDRDSPYRLTVKRNATGYASAHSVYMYGDVQRTFILDASTGVSFATAN